MRRAKSDWIDADAELLLRKALAWLWQRYQPGAAQVVWFRERTGSSGRRVRKVMVVALARKLLIELWRFVVDRVVPKERS